jgi:hypothetical protein
MESVDAKKLKQLKSENRNLKHGGIVDAGQSGVEGRALKKRLAPVGLRAATDPAGSPSVLSKQLDT